MTDDECTTCSFDTYEDSMSDICTDMGHPDEGDGCCACGMMVYDLDPE